MMLINILFCIFLILRLIFVFSCIYYEERKYKKTKKPIYEGSIFRYIISYTRYAISYLIFGLLNNPVSCFILKFIPYSNQIGNFLHRLAGSNNSLQILTNYRLSSYYVIIINHPLYKFIKFIGFFSFVIIKYLPVNDILVLIFALIFLAMFYVHFLIFTYTYKTLYQSENFYIFKLLIPPKIFIIIQIIYLFTIYLLGVWTYKIYLHLSNNNFSYEHYYLIIRWLLKLFF